MGLGSLDNWETSVGVAGIGEPMGVDSGVSSDHVKSVEAIAVDAGIGGVRDSGGEDSGGSGHERGGGGDLVHGGRGLLGGQTSSGGVIKSSGEGSLGGGNVLGVGNIGGGDLGSLGVGVHRGQSGELSGLGGGEGSVKGGLGLGDLGGVLDGEGGGNSQDRGNQLKEKQTVIIGYTHFTQTNAVVPVCTFCLWCPENLQSD